MSPLKIKRIVDPVTPIVFPRVSDLISSWSCINSFNRSGSFDKLSINFPFFDKILTPIHFQKACLKMYWGGVMLSQNKRRYTMKTNENSKRRKRQKRGLLFGGIACKRACGAPQRVLYRNYQHCGKSHCYELSESPIGNHHCEYLKFRISTDRTSIG